jgi:hypothetical protein
VADALSDRDRAILQRCLARAMRLAAARQVADAATVRRELARSWQRIRRR